MGSPETLINQNQCDHRGNLFSSDLTNIKVPKKVANLVRVYCIFNNRKVSEFVTGILTKELKGFNEKVERMNKI